MRIELTTNDQNQPVLSLTFMDKGRKNQIVLPHDSEDLVIVIGGEEVFWLDTYPLQENDPAQLIVYHPNKDEPLAKVVLEEPGPVVVVNKEAVRGETRHTIYHEGDDVFTFEDDPS